MADANLTAARLRAVLHYDPATGNFTRLVSCKGFAAGIPAGGPDSHGYTRIGIDRRRYLAHRLAWLYVHGVWPVNDIDHINGIRTCNRIDNLREATRGENHQNLRRPQSNNRSGFLGVSWCNVTHSYVAELTVGGESVWRQSQFTSAEAAGDAYLQAKRRLHPFFPS